jgi:superfamily II DNA helicase RecQ
MSTLPPPFDWSKRLLYKWTSEEGLERLRNTVAPLIHYETHQFQLFDSGCILNGVDVFCITHTGGGKSALILFPALARKEMINIMIEPTNVLESDMVRLKDSPQFEQTDLKLSKASNLWDKGVKAVVINAKTLAAATQIRQNLWQEAKECRYQVITLAPEALKLYEFYNLIKNECFRAHWGILTVDEAHLMYE